MNDHYLHDALLGDEVSGDHPEDAVLADELMEDTEGGVPMSHDEKDPLGLFRGVMFAVPLGIALWFIVLVLVAVGLSFLGVGK